MQVIYRNRVGAGAIWTFVDTAFQPGNASGTNISRCEQTLGVTVQMPGKMTFFNRGNLAIWVHICLDFYCSAILSARKCSGATSSLALRSSFPTVLPHGARDRIWSSHIQNICSSPLRCHCTTFASLANDFHRKVELC